MKLEQNYDFRKRYCTPHRRIADYKGRVPKENELELRSPVLICSDVANEVAEVAIKDLIAYLKTAFGITASVTEKSAEAVIRISLADSMAGDYMARRIVVDGDGVVIEGADERGIAQAIYTLEERMNDARAPFLSYGETEQRPLFAPRMIHSGYGMDVFPDEYISVCAHYGYDTLLSYVRSVEDRAELASLVKRAARYGLDVYAYCAFENFVHPEDEGAKEIFAEAYGGIFRDAPGLKGIVFVGESVEFPSRDPHVECRSYRVPPADGIPTGRPTPGWWPCYDYAEWITMIRDSVRAVTPDADIVFWTYNWGCTPKEDRLALIDRLPTDISLQVTFEMFERQCYGNGFGEVCDYTISFSGPGQYFLSEAEAAHRRGIRLYTMANTAGKTWDFGVIPYEPFPQRWRDRHEKLLECREKYGLCGLMESHHYGFAPSFIARLANATFTEGSEDYQTRLCKVAKRFSETEYEEVLQAISLLDESQKYYVPSSENQYGPYRIGPSYPFCIKRGLKKPNGPDAVYGNGIYDTLLIRRENMRRDPYSLRLRDELRMHKEALLLSKQALYRFKHIKNKNVELQRLINMVEFIVRCHMTAVNYKEFYLQTIRMLNEVTREGVKRCAKQIERIALREIENAKATVPLVQRDSSLGYEPSMGYQTDEAGIRWKLKQMDYMLNSELPIYLDF